jgi:hypothetical protein
MLHKLGHNKKWGGYIYRTHMAHHHNYNISNLIQDKPYKGDNGERAFLPIIFLIWFIVYIIFDNFITSIFIIQTSMLLLLSNYIHEQFHIKNSWLENNDITKEWFLERRNYHFYHHHKQKFNMSLSGISYCIDNIMNTYHNKKIK